MDFLTQEERNEYFVREYDESQVKGDRNLLGKYFMVSRYIWRTGYMFEPQMMSDGEVDKEAEQLLLEAFQLGILQKHPLRSPLVDHHVEHTEESKKMAEYIMRVFREKNYPLPIYKARGIVAQKKRREYGEDAEWRRMWFLDVDKWFPHYDRIVVKLVETRRVLTGEWYPPEGGYDSWSGEYDYTPGGLSPCFHQTVFQVLWHDPLVKGWNPVHFYKERLVHPNDLLPVETDLPILEEE